MVPKPDAPTAPKSLHASVDTVASLRERWRLWKLQHDNTALTPTSAACRGQKLSENFLQRHVADEGLRTH